MGDFKTVMAEKVKNIFLGFIEEDKLDAYIEEVFTSFNENEMKEMIVDEMKKHMQKYISESLQQNQVWNANLQKFENESIKLSLDSMIKEQPELLFGQFFNTLIQPVLHGVMHETFNRIKNGHF